MNRGSTRGGDATTGSHVPRPSGLRLETRARSVRPRPPFGLEDWSDDAAAIAVALDAETCDIEDPVAVAAGIPEASSLEPGTRVYVLGAASRGAGILARLRGSLPVSRVTRCTALLVRGYVEIGAGVDEVSGADLAWGMAL
jgi:hypothetical protein